MALYSLTYDLVNSRNYQRLYDELERFGALRVTESQWYLKHSNTDVERLREHFKQFVDGDDRLMVARIANIQGVSGWAGKKLLNSPNDL